jgi:MFS superfamily sulfate permease-like transporter
MIEVKGFPQQGRMVVRYQGRISLEDAEGAEERIREALPELGPAFDLIVDVSQAEPVEPDVVKAVTRTQKLLVRSGLRTHVRVVGRRSRTAVQFERISRSAGDEAHLAFSFSEAEEVLDGLP